MKINKIILSILLLIFLSHNNDLFADNSPLQKADCGRVDRLIIYSPEMGEDINIDIWVPSDYNPCSSHRYPVIYMHDGQNLFDSETTWNHQSWEMDSVACELINKGEISAPIIVGIHSFSDKRVADLMPQKAVSKENLDKMFKGLGYKEVPVKGDAYARFMVNTLKPEIDMLYNTLPDMANTGVMGSSMGGLMSIYAISEYPDVFGTALCLSTHWIGGNEIVDSFAQGIYDYLDKNLPSASNHRLYIDRGTETLDAYYGQKDEMMKSLMRKKGYNKQSNFKDFVDQGGAHEEKSWAKRVELPLKFFLSKQGHVE